VDLASRGDGVKFLLAFALWATLLFVPAWWGAHAWQHALSAVATRLVAPPGSVIEMTDLELFYPVDLAVFLALCFASGWASWERRARAALLGAPPVIAAELVTLSLALVALLGASGPGVDAAHRDEAGRLADGLIRVTGIAAALVAWFVLLGRERLGDLRRVARGAAILAVGTIALATCAPRAASAHGVGSGQIELVVDGTRIDGAWSLDLKDARVALGLDPGVTGPPGAADLRTHAPALASLLARSMTLTADARPVAVTFDPDSLTWDPQWNSVRMSLHATCVAPPTRLGLGTTLLYDANPNYRTYFSVEDARVTSIGVLRATQRSAAFGVRQFHLGEVIWEFVRDGMAHIWSGIDHLLFLTALLLPAPLIRIPGGWVPRPRLGPSAREVLKVVTAFTIAHSITLSLAFFGVVRLPAQWIEVGIAASVFAAAWNNLRPFLPGRAWVMAFGFGLVHGMGFAGALGNLALPRHARVLALAAFNGGVELGQLAVVAAILPVLYLASRRSWYPRVVMGIGSLAIAWMAVIWILERAFSLSLFAHG
jgi:hypothetical protein